MSRFQQQLDRALNKEADSVESANVSWIPHVDIHEEAERFVVVADVPGVESQGHRDHRREGRADGHGRAPLGEEGLAPTATRASSVPVARSCVASRLPESADAEAIKATHVNGVLELSIPKRPQEQPRRITIQAA